MTDQEKTFLLTLREVAMLCPDEKLRQEIRELADAMEAVIYDLYRHPTEDMLRALNCLYSYSVRLVNIVTSLNTPPTGGGHQPVPLNQEPQAAVA